MEPARCTRCDDVIGVYEPLVVVDADGVRHTALAAEPHLAAQRRGGDALYHRLCYAALQIAHGGNGGITAT